MNNDIQIFKSEEFGDIRTVTVNNEPWFVGKDVAEALGYAKPLNALSTHVEKDDSLKQGTHRFVRKRTGNNIHQRIRVIRLDLRKQVGIS